MQFWLILPSSLRKKRWLIDYGENLKFGGGKKKNHLPASGTLMCIHAAFKTPIICRAVFQIGFISKMNFVRGLRIFGLAAMSLLP
jgi:hypothetical protein